MALDDSPWVFRYDNKWFVSETPREEMVRQLTAQRAWDTRNSQVNRWPLAIGIGAALGAAAMFAVTTLLGAPPVINLFLLPVGFAIGAVLGGRIAESMRKKRPEDVALGARPTVDAMTKLPRKIVADGDPLLSAREIIRLVESPQR